MHEAYMILLVAIPALAVFRILFVCHPDEAQMIGCVGIVVLNWCANTAFVIMAGVTNPVPVFLMTDLFSMGAISFMPSRWAAALGTTYIGQVAIHGLHLTGGIPDPYYYWQILTGIGFLQFAVLAAWILAPSPCRRFEEWLR